MSNVLVEASPYINTKKGNDKARKDLYHLPFDYCYIANRFGERPIKMDGYWESDEGFQHRLDEWEKAEKDVLFTGWVCKDLHHFQELRMKNIFVTLNTTTYEINYEGRIFVFPVLPDTIDDFINDLKRIGIKVFWKQEIVDLYGIENVTSPEDEKITDYYELLKSLDGSSS